MVMKLTFITGGAGVGKSYTLKEMISKEQRRFVVTAPTGIAALNCNGVTIHSAFRIDPGNGFVNPAIKYGPLRGIEVIYIDEVSMVSADLMESIFNAAEMLGVKEIIAFGDLAQLKPVKGNWFFEFKEPDEVRKLTTQYRQGNDKRFAEVLNSCRTGFKYGPCDPNAPNGIADAKAFIEYLNTHKGDSGEGITLAYANDTVNRINAQALANIDAPLIENPADCYNMTERDVTAPANLQIKVGAKVIMLNNDRAKRWQNGTRGEVAMIQDMPEAAPMIWVDIAGERHEVNEYVWQKKVPKKLTEERREYWEGVEAGHTYHSTDRYGNTDYEADKALARHTLKNGYELEVVGSFTQFPMKLGYASTVHKSQGLTLDKVIIRPDGFDTSHGLGYVALSRLTTLEGLTTYRKLKKDDFICNPKVLPYL